MIWFEKSMASQLFKNTSALYFEAGEGGEKSATKNEGLKWAELNRNLF